MSLKNGFLLIFGIFLVPVVSLGNSCTWKYSNPYAWKNYNLYITYSLENGSSKSTFCGVSAGPLEDSFDHDTGKNLIEYQYNCVSGGLAVLTFLDVLVGSKSVSVLFKTNSYENYTACYKE